jgi:hypothetical protein
MALESPKIQQPRVDSVALLELLKNPLRRFFRKPTLPGAADDYRNADYVLVLCTHIDLY